jgi:hypothetical protein
MPKKKRVPIGKVRPVVEVGLGGTPPGQGRTIVLGSDDVWIGSDDPVIDVTALLVAKPRVTPPRPKYIVRDRPGRTGATQYVGHDPMEMVLPIKFDNGGRSVEPRITTLWRLLRRLDKAGGQPPLVKVQGAGVPQLNPKVEWWRVTDIAELDERILYTGDGERRLYVANVTLQERVVDQQLAESLTAVSPVGRPTGIRNRTITVRTGEDTLYDVARRVFGNPQKAADIANANPALRLRLGSRLRPGQKLRVP